MLVVQDIEVLEHILVSDIRAAEGHGLVEYREGVPHRPVCLMGYDMQGFIVDLYVFLLGYMPEVLYNVLNGNPVEVVCLASGQDGRQYFMLFCRCEYENGVCGRFLECLEESVERGLGQHMYLVDYVDAVFPDLRRYPDLLHKGLDVIYTVVGGCIKLVYAV